jgi:high-affinity iron transporter
LSEVFMLASFLLSLREGIEAALIIGILLGALRQTHREKFTPTVWYGAVSAGIVSLLAAILLTFLGLEMKDPGEAIFEGFTMLIAAGLLTWMIFWMSRTARTLKSNMEANVQRASEVGTRALFLVAFIAVLREGIELALFLTASVFASDALQATLGAILGLGTAILLGWTIFATTVRLDLRRFFQFTSFLLILFAAGLVAHGVHAFNELGWIPPIIEHVWDVSAFVSSTSTFGQLLAALFGYNPMPSLTEILAYAAYFILVFVGMKRFNKPIPATA